MNTWLYDYILFYVENSYRPSHKFLRLGCAGPGLPQIAVFAAELFLERPRVSYSTFGSMTRIMLYLPDQVRVGWWAHIHCWDYAFWKAGAALLPIVVLFCCWKIKTLTLLHVCVCMYVCISTTKTWFLGEVRCQWRTRTSRSMFGYWRTTGSCSLASHR